MAQLLEESQAMSNPKILIAGSTFPPDPGGPSIHAQKQSEYFKSQGALSGLVILANYRHYPRWIRHLLFLFALFHKALHSNIIYAYDAWGVGFPALVVSRLTGNKLVLRIGGDLAWEREVENGKVNKSLLNWYKEGLYKRNFFYLLTKIVIPRADLIIVPTKLLKDIYINYYGAKEGNIRIIDNPVPQENSAEREVAQKIVFAGRLVGYKNLEFIINNLKDILLSHSELKFVIIGDGPEKERLESEVYKLGLVSQVEFKGLVPQQQVFEELSTALFALAPALTEFNPNYILEAISSHKPFLISREHGFNFVIPEEYTFDSLNGEELKAKVTNLLDPDNYEKAKSWVGGLQLKQSWGDNLAENLNYLNQI